MADEKHIQTSVNWVSTNLDAGKIATRDDIDKEINKALVSVLVRIEKIEKFTDRFSDRSWHLAYAVFGGLITIILALIGLKYK